MSDRVQRLDRVEKLGLRAEILLDVCGGNCATARPPIETRELGVTSPLEGGTMPPAKLNCSTLTS